MPFAAPLFLLTGFCWLLLSAAWGLALFLGMVMGWSLPPVLRALHPHSALVGGGVQIVVGLIIRARGGSRTWLYAALNAGTIGLLGGFMLGHAWIMAGAGLLLLLAFLPLTGETVKQPVNGLVVWPLHLWLYGTAWLALLISLGMGEALALHLLPATWVGQGRLAHIHLGLLGFTVLMLAGRMHDLLPTVLNVRLHSPALARWTFVLLPVGFFTLIAGFLTGNLLLDLVAGAVVIAAAALLTYNLMQTWIDAGRIRLAASDHFVLAAVFLLLAAVTGLLVAVNAFWHPTPMPFGKLHLIAYTHLALVGFMVLAGIGVLSHLLPIDLAAARVKSNKKRGAYLAELVAIAERRQALQLGSLSLGTIGLALVASLVWQFNMVDWPVRSAAWASAGLLTMGLALVVVNLLQILTRQPDSRSDAS